MTVVLVGEGDRKEFELLADAVEDRGGDPVLWDTREWPGDRPVTFDVGSSTVTVGEPYRVEDVTGVFAWSNHLFDLRQRRFVEEFEGADLEDLYTKLDCWRGLFDGLLPLFEAHGATVFSPPETQHYHDTKPLQLSRFVDADVPIPETLITNDGSRVREFVREHGEVVYKPLTKGAHPGRLSKENIEDAPLERLANAPVQFQEYVPGEDLRVYFLDSRVVGASRYVTDEWTFKNADGDPRDAEPVDLREEIRSAVARAAETAPVRFGAADVRATDDSFALLEVNTDPRFAFHDEMDATDVAGILAEELVGGTE